MKPFISTLLLLPEIHSFPAPFQIYNDICVVDLCNRSSYVFREGQRERSPASLQTAEN